VCSLALGFCAGTAAAQQTAPPRPAPIAVVTDVDGKAAVVRGGHRRDLLVLDLLERSDRLLLAAKARVEIAFFSDTPRVFLLSGPGRFTLRSDTIIGADAAGLVAVRDLAPAWRTLQIRPGLVGRASVALRGVSDVGLELLLPVGAQLDAALDTLRWSAPYGPAAEGWQYAVRLVDAQGAVVFSVRTRATEVALPARRSWLREQPYLWTVEATADDGRRARAAAEFRVVDQSTQERMGTLAQLAQQAQARLQGADARGAVEEVLLAIALDQAGLRSEADRQWRAVAARRPVFANALGAQSLVRQ